MLCLQNIGNLYRKNAYKVLTAPEETEAEGETAVTEKAEASEAASTAALGPLSTLSREAALKVFDESIDFSLEAGVPDPLPFEKKLRSMLDDHAAFLLPEQHKIGHRCVACTTFSLFLYHRY